MATLPTERPVTPLRQRMLDDMAMRSMGARHAGRPAANSASLALGALIDGVPESIVIGTSLLAGGAIGWVAVAAVFLANPPEGLSSAAGARTKGQTAMFTFELWTGIAAVAGLA